MDFSPSDAAFEGFRLARRRPLTILAFAVLGFLSLLATYWLMDVSGYWQAMAALAKVKDPEEVVAYLPPLVRMMFGILGLVCVMSALQSAAVFRGVLRPRESGVLGLSLGPDEARLLVVAVIMVAMGLVVLFATTLVLALVLSILRLTRYPALTETITDGVILAMAVWLTTRMSLAGPATFAQRRITIFASWGLTRGRFAKLLGCYVLALFLALLVGFIAFVVGVIVASLATGTPFTNALAEFFSRQPGVAVNLFSPVRLVYAVINALFGGLVTMVVTAPAAEAYRQIHGGSQEDAFN